MKFHIEHVDYGNKVRLSNSDGQYIDMRPEEVHGVARLLATQNGPFSFSVFDCGEITHHKAPDPELYVVALYQPIGRKGMPHHDEWREFKLAVPRYEKKGDVETLVGTEPGHIRGRVDENGRGKVEGHIIEPEKLGQAWTAIGLSTSSQPGAPCVVISLANDGELTRFGEGDSITFRWDMQVNFSGNGAVQRMVDISDMQGEYLRRIAALPAIYQVLAP